MILIGAWRTHALHVRIAFENEVKNKTKEKVGTLGQGESDTSQSKEGTHIEKVAHTTAHTDASESSCVDPAALLGGNIDDEEGKLCKQRWKNARADHESGKRLVVFNKTGIFVVSCQHGAVMLVEDMRRSGELSKYGLAAVDRLVRVFGDNILIGYDIGCTFRITALGSPLVGPLVKKHNTRFAVGSFHGYAHQRKCQVANHPLHIEGASLKSFEQNEQLFSSTNTIARTTRHASAFHRRQHLALRLSGWDADRRAAL
ncbi:hypothetical protein FRC07_013945, partial [Ceratobasidium sp. 392]